MGTKGIGCEKKQVGAPSAQGRDGKWDGLVPDYKNIRLYLLPGHTRATVGSVLNPNRVGSWRWPSGFEALLPVGL